MADANTPATSAPVTVVPAAPAPGTPEHDAAMATKFDQRTAVAPATVTAPAAPAPVAEPILGKFKTQEDLVKAYTELEKKLSAAPAPAPATPPATPPAADPTKSPLTVDTTQQAPEQKAAAEATQKAGVDFTALSKEFADTGKLSEDTYKKLSDGGIPKEMVDGYIAGQTALAAKAAQDYDNAAFAQAGGEAKFMEMTKWAAASLPLADKTAFNEAVTSGDKTKMQLAVSNLKNQFEANFGAAPTGAISGVTTTATLGYESVAQMKADMAKPEYRSDPAFRAKVEQRVAVSQLWNEQSRT
jgi:hypothetical protein